MRAHVTFMSQATGTAHIIPSQIHLPGSVTFYRSEEGRARGGSSHFTRGQSSEVLHYRMRVIFYSVSTCQEENLLSFGCYLKDAHL